MRLFAPPKNILVLDARGVTAGATASATFEHARFGFVSLDIYGSSVAAATNRPSTIMLSESDTTEATAFEAIASLVGDGSHGFVIPNWYTSTATRQVVKINIDLRTRKRYLLLSITPRTTQDFIAMANLVARRSRAL